ncbi:serine/threonine-protein kinase [Verrucomicrobiales bacterium BCK34]|nr:serine/threonine-protein kinase [Verrucomicrobiales bacterium BCK34]
MGERYEVRGKLGRGGMSTVYRAYDTVMGREVALKRLLDLEDTNLNEESKGALQREAGALAKFQHPNVVTVFAIEEDADGPFVAMELVEGEDLNEVVKDAALSVEDFVDVAEQCLDALASAGEINLLHRDIKPANIMLTMTPSGRFLVKILDFGLAKFSQNPSTQTLDHQGTFLGSIDYIAPEQLELKPLDQRTDLYSLGCVLYCGLTQESAFQGGNPAETSMNHINHRCTPVQEIRPDLPEHIAAWVMRLISRDPDDRPSDAKDAMKQFQDAVKGIPYESGDDSDIPVAVRVSDPEPVAPPQEKPAQTGPTRTIQTGPTRSIQTGPTRTIQTGAIKAPLKPSVDVNRSVTGALRTTAGSAPVRGTSYSRASGEKDFPVLPVAIGTLIVIIVIAGIAFLGSGDKGGEEVVAEVKLEDKKVAVEEAVPVETKRSIYPKPSTGELAYPESLPVPDGALSVPALPVTDGLVGRFVSSTGTYGRDYQSNALPDTRIAAWYNLARPEPLASLVREPADTEGNALPLMRIYTPESIPGLNEIRRGILLNNLSSMKVRSNDFDFSQGVSVVLAMTFMLEQEQIIRFGAVPWNERSLVIGTDYSGSVYGGVSLGRGKPWQKVDIGWWDHEPGLIGYVCDVIKRTHRLFKIEKSGREESTGAVAFEGDFGGFNQFSIGRRQQVAKIENEEGHVMFECAIYDRVLNEGEMKSVQRQLFKHYFKVGE